MTIKTLVHGVGDAVLKRLTDRLVGLQDRKYKISQIAVFGSRTKGTHRNNSDLDVALILLDGAKDMRKDERASRILKFVIEDFEKASGIKLDLNVFDVMDVGSGTKFSWSDLVKIYPV